MRVYNTNYNITALDLVNKLKQINPHYFKSVKDMNDFIQVTCPFHKNGQERTPSSGINKKTGFFHCFACNKKCDIYTVINKVTNKDGQAWLKSIATYDERITRDTIIDKPDEKTKYYDKRMINIYNNSSSYLSDRGISKEIQEKFETGFDKYNNAVTFPVKDINGKILGFVSRNIKTKFFNNIKNMTMPLYGLYEVKDTRDEIYVCESIIDALTLWSYNKKAVALCGLGNKLQIEQLKTLQARTLILALDNDKPGKQASNKLYNKLKDYKIIKKAIIPEDKKDINELSPEEIKNLETRWLI